MSWTTPGTRRWKSSPVSLGFQYHSRPRQGLPRLDAKSGNLNFGLSLSRGEIILVLDADQVPQAEIISRMVGFFNFPRVAYVQSRQQFLLPDDDPFYNRDDVFYETIQLSNDQANAVISCGSGVLYRRQALMDIGGFVTWNLVEDFTTSYELVSRGWRGIYFPYALSRGLAPDTLPGVFRQRYQWCLDTMRLCFWDNPWRKPGLSFFQRLHFSITMLTYAISGLILPIFYFLPLYCYLTGHSFLVEQELSYFSLRGLYLVSTIFGLSLSLFRKEFFKAAQNALRPLSGLRSGHLGGPQVSPGEKTPLPGKQLCQGKSGSPPGSIFSHSLLLFPCTCLCPFYPCLWAGLHPGLSVPMPCFPPSPSGFWVKSFSWPSASLNGSPGCTPVWSITNTRSRCAKCGWSGIFCFLGLLFWRLWVAEPYFFFSAHHFFQQAQENLRTRRCGRGSGGSPAGPSKRPA